MNLNMNGMNLYVNRMNLKIYISTVKYSDGRVFQYFQM